MATTPHHYLHGLTIEEVTLLSRESNKAKSRAYCPYSNFQVGCAVLLDRPASPSSSAETAEATTQVITGANIENAAYPVGTCAERVAFGTAIATYGVLQSTSRTPQPPSNQSPGTGAAVFRAIAVASNSTDPCSPCGMCRQFLREFCALSMPVFMFTTMAEADISSVSETSTPASFWTSADGASGARGVGVVDGKRFVVRTLEALLPMSFGPDNLIKHVAERQQI